MLQCRQKEIYIKGSKSMAKLNYEFYTGNYEYSDGDIEDDILKIVTENRNGDYQNIIKEDKRWPVFYHLSNLRHNILNWYPFKENCSILEVGSGCGALTGLFCKRAKKVISVELTYKRSQINFERHKELKNLEIYVGNICDMKFEEKFDYIVLNGVFEYTNSFISSNYPYVDFMRILKENAVSDGKILIAIENRLGLKYFAGAPEDHTGVIFDGINNYRNSSSVRTFSKEEIKDIVTEVGLLVNKFYYPYPDYKFCSHIYTDEAYENLNQNYDKYSLDKGRICIFDEASVYRDLVKEKIADRFANSFLVEVVNKIEDKDKEIVYVKFSNDRNEKFKIITSVINENQKLKVLKTFDGDDSKQHISSMYDTFLKMQTTKAFQYNKAYKENGYLAFEYVNGYSFEKCLLDSIVQSDTNEYLAMIGRYYNMINMGSVKVSDYNTKEFETVFGETKLNHEENCINPANIDLIFENIIKREDTFVIIDYEWTFNFYIPTKYIFWRALEIFYEKYGAIVDNLYSLKSLLELYQIDDNMLYAFKKWNKHFLKEYVNYNEQLGNYVKPELNVSLSNMLKKAEPNSIVSALYVDTGKGYNEEQKLYSKALFDGEKYSLYFNISSLKGIKDIRFDPLELDLCRINIINIDTDIINFSFGASNASLTSGNYYEFWNMDPMLELKGDFEHASYLKIYLTIDIISAKEIQYKLLTEVKSIGGNLESNIDKSIILKQKEDQMLKDLMTSLQEIKKENEQFFSLLNNEQRQKDQLSASLNKKEYQVERLQEENKDLIEQIEGIKKSKTFRFASAVKKLIRRQ